MQAAEYTRTSQLDSITIPNAPRLGDQVVTVDGLSKAFGGRLLIDKLSFDVPPGAVVGTNDTHAPALLLVAQEDVDTLPNSV